MSIHCLFLRLPFVDLRIRLLLSLVFAGQIFMASCDAAPLIPVERTFGAAWQNAGYPGSIPSPSIIVNVRDYGATGDGVTDDRAAISSAIAALGGSAGVVYFPAGNYKMKSALAVPDGCVLRGERPSNTTLTLEHISNGIVISKSQGSAPQPIVSGAETHSSTVVVTTGADFAPGDYAEINEDPLPAWNANTDWGNLIGQIVRITAVSGNELTLERPLRLTFPAEQNPWIRKITPVTEAGVENIKITRVMMGTEVQRNNRSSIYFGFAARCWVRGVEMENGFGTNIDAEYSTKLSVTGCFIHNALEWDGGGSGYGVRLQFKTGECLVENNVFQSLRHAMLLQAGPNGNVFGYNYSREAKRTEYPSEASGDIVLHGNYPFANLFEGNVCQHIWPDNSHGANGPLNTFFRNRAELCGINVTDTLITRLNVVGNETYTYGNIVVSLGVGNGYALKGPDRFEYGNNTQSGGVQPSSTTNLTDYSYYLNGNPEMPPPVPSWWNITNSIPTIGLPLPRTTDKDIPARTRYFAGGVKTYGPPSLAVQPVALSLAAGEPGAFSVQASGTPVAQFAWRKNGVPIAGETSSTLSFAAVQPDDAGSYDCVVSDDGGSVTSAAVMLEVSDNFSAWAARNGVSGETDDYDADGLANLAEYLLGSDPRQSSPGALAPD